MQTDGHSPSSLSNMSDPLCASESVQTDSPPLSPSKSSPSEWVVVTKPLTRTVSASSPDACPTQSADVAPSPNPILTDYASSSRIADHYSDAFVAAERPSSLKRKLSQSPEQDYKVTKSSTWEDRLIQLSRERDREAVSPSAMRFYSQPRI